MINNNNSTNLYNSNFHNNIIVTIKKLYFILITIDESLFAFNNDLKKFI